MHRSKGKGRAFTRAATTIGFALASATAMAKTVPFASGQFMLPNGKTATPGTVSQDNIAIRSLTVGSRTIRMDDGRNRAPILVRAVDAAGTPTELQTELAAGMIRVPGMTALDAMSGMDLGRMVQAGGDRATTIQVFLSMKEQDDDAFVDDSSPELVLFGKGEGAPLRVRAILDGTPDQPATLSFGPMHDVPASAFAKGTLPVRMRYGTASETTSVAAVGLDLSGDLGVGPGQTVVGYEIEVPAGSSMPFKALAAGKVEFGAFANYSEFASLLARGTMGQVGPSLSAAAMADLSSDETRFIGPTFLGEVERRPLNYQEPPSIVGQYIPPEVASFSETGGQAFNTPPVFPTAPAVPGPGVLATLAASGALGLGRRRRRS